MTAECRQVFVTGRVQGVGFRYYTREAAAERRVTGWVRNLPDGRVEAWVEGSPKAVADMLAWLERGPSHARVTNAEVHEREAQGFARFEIRR